MYQVEKNSKRKYAINLSHIAKIAGVRGEEKILTLLRDYPPPERSEGGGGIENTHS